jgi:CIC family chloride channel protein
LPFYALAAIAVAAGAAAFVGVLHRVQRSAAKLPEPAWLRPAFGGLALGLVAVLVLIIGPTMLHVPPALLGVLGGGYGAAQLARVRR